MSVPTSLPQDVATKLLLSHVGDTDVIIAALGTSTFHLYSEHDRELNYYMWGGMGLAGDIALGLALAAPGRVVVAADSDGALMMNMGVLATIGRHGPQNLIHVLWDNEAYVTTGGQPTDTHLVDFCAIARACGYGPVIVATTADELDEGLKLVFHSRRNGGSSPAFVRAKVMPVSFESKPAPDPVSFKYRFMDALAREGVGRTAERQTT